MPIYKIRCKLNYHYLLIDEIDVFAVGVRNGIYDNPATFSMPTISPLVFQALIDGYVNARGAYKAGTAAKATFLAAKDALMNSLNDLADYVNTVANNDANIIMLANYQPTKGSISSVNPPSQPQNVVIKRGISGELLVDCQKVATAVYYGAILIADNPLPDDIMINEAGQIVVVQDNNPIPPTLPMAHPGHVILKFILDLNKSRRKKFIALVKGKLYYVYYYAGNAGGVSPLSEGVSLDPL